MIFTDTEVVIAPIAASQLAEAEALAIAAWTPIRESFREILGDAVYETVFANWQEEKRADVRRELSGGNGFAAMLGGRLAGFISYRVAGEVGIVGTNAVAPEFRGHGIAPKLYEFVLGRMRAEGCRVACVHTGGDERHAPARRAYEKAGFDKSLPNVTYYREL